MITVAKIQEIMQQAGIARGKTIASDRSLADQGLDSYDRMALLFELEQALDMEIPNQDATKLKTLDDIVEYVNSSD